MFTSADKVSKHTATVQRQSPQPFFARKADAFFSGSEHSTSSSTSFIQPKLSVSSPDDPQEKEADSMAEKVMTMPDTATVYTAPADDTGLQKKGKEEEESLQMKGEEEEEMVQAKGEEEEAQTKQEEEKDTVQPKISAGSVGINTSAMVQTMCNNCKEEKKVDRKANGMGIAHIVQRSYRGPPAEADISNSFESNLHSTRGTGSPMQHDTRTFMESRFSADFSGVRIHTNDTAVQMNQQIHAQAFAYGNDIYFNNGKYSPSSNEGKTLLAHELTHTIQQGASSHVSQPSNKAPPASTVSSKRLSRKLSIQRSTSNLTAAVNLARGEQGKVIANKEGPDGMRFGWQRLMEYFKTTLGSEKVVPDSLAGADPKTVAEGNIKKKNIAHGMNIITPDGKVAVGDRDAMPSWCGIFAFWSLNKAGIPMKKWILGGMTIPPEAAIPPGTTPQPGYIAYRNLRSHYGLVSAASGSQVITVNGNTAGSDNLGGEIQEQTHEISNWTGFFDPMKLAEGTVRNPSEGVEGPPKSLQDMQQEMFGVHTKREEGEGNAVQAKHKVQYQTATTPVAEQKQEEEVQKKDEHKEEKQISRKEQIHTAAAGDKPVQEEDKLQRKEEDREQEMSGDGGEKIHKSSDNSSPKEELKRKEEHKDENATVSRKEMIHLSADSSPPKQEEEIQKKEEREGQVETVQQKEMIHLSADSSPPAKEEEQVQRKSAPKVQRLFGWVSDVVEWAGDKLEEGKKWLLNEVKELIIDVPGYKALRVVLGNDPISGERVERNGYNFIDAAIDLMPGGVLIKKKLQELGILDQAALFVERAYGRVRTLITGIYDTFSRFFSSISLSDLKDIPGVLRRLERAFTSFFNQIIDFAKGLAKDFLEFIKKALLIPLGNYIKTKTRYWDLLCLVIGKDPLTDEVKTPTGANILNAILNLSEWGMEQRKKMQETGTFNKVAAWIDRGISVFSRAYQLLKDAFAGLWKAVSIESLMDPKDTFLRIFNSFWQPIALVGRFFLDAGIAILNIVKEVLFTWISNKAKETRGYFLITVLISKDPFTGERVPRTTQNLIKGFMLLSANGEQQYNKMKESGAIDRATAKINAAVKTLGFTWAYVKGLFTSLWKSFSWTELLVPIVAFARIIDTFGKPILRLIRFVVTVIVALFEVILRMMGFPVDLIFQLIENVKKAWKLIKSNPTGFLINLLKAIKQGFSQFFKNILTHLWNGLKAWLQKELKDAGVPMPEDYSVMGIIKWLLAVLDITMEKIWKKLEARIGKEKVDKIRGLIAKAEAVYDKANEAIDFINDIRKRGMMAIVDKIKEQLTNIWDLVLGAIQDFIMERVVKKVTEKLLTMLDPTGVMAVVNSAIALYKAIQSFIKYITEMLQIVNSFVQGIVEICTGNITKAANFLEKSLAQGIPIVIGFLANQASINLSGRIKEILGKVRVKVDKGLDFVIDKMVGFAEKLVSKLKAAKDKVLGWLGLKKTLKTQDNVSHTLYFQGSGASAKLMIATTPMEVKKYLNDEVKTKHGLKDNDIKAAMKVAGDIEKLEKQPAADEPAEAKKVTDMGALLSQLADEIAKLPLTTAGTNSDTMYGPKYHEHGTSATVAFRKAPFPHGSIPMGSSTTTLAKINVRKNGGSPFYIKGHLLNENLGGPGTKWENLTPISSQANSDHKNFFENEVKLAVNGKKAGYSSTTLGYMKAFSVVTTHGRSDPASLTQLKDDNASTYPTGFDAANWDEQEVIDMLEYEKYAPLTMVCKATIKPKGAAAEKLVSYTVDNKIDHGVLSKYQLGLQPKVPVVLADIIKANNKAADEKAMEAAFKGAGLKAIGPARAKSIFDAFKAKGKVTNGKADIGIGMIALNKLNKGKYITSGTYSGPW